MRKKNFIGPAIFLIFLAVFYLTATGLFIYYEAYAEVGISGASLLRSLPLYWYLSTLLWPVLMLVETIIYWSIRKRNLLRKASWSHVCLFAFAYLSYFIKGGIIAIASRIETKNELSNFAEVLSRIQLLVFWFSIIGGHIFFIRVLRKARAQKRLQPIADPANLLDDVLSER